MYKQFKIFFILLLIHSSVYYSQTNLVINPSFENYSGCPTSTAGEVNKAIGWDTCRASSDYFNVCGTVTDIQIPENLVGHQYPAHGNAYCGFATYSSSQFYRELIIGQLYSPLTVSQKYYISFKVSRADSNFFVGYSTNKLGVKFTKAKQNYVPINNTAHYYSNNVITDTINWTKIFGSFVSDSAYQYLMIGNFFDDANTTVFNHGNGLVAYYYIDEVCVSTDSSFSQNYSTGINSFLPNNNLSIFPNPANNFFSIKGMFENKINIYNMLGEEIFVSEVKSNSFLIDCSYWPAGLYFIESKNNRQKIIINH